MFGDSFDSGNDPGFGFLGADHMVMNDDEHLRDNVEDYDDDKNDLTFGDDTEPDIGSIVDQWQELSSRTSAQDQVERTKKSESSNQVAQPLNFEEKNVHKPPPTSEMPIPSHLLSKGRPINRPAPNHNIGDGIWSPSGSFDRNEYAGLESQLMSNHAHMYGALSSSPVMMPPPSTPFNSAGVLSVEELERQMIINMQLGTPPSNFNMPYVMPSQPNPSPEPMNEGTRITTIFIRRQQQFHTIHISQIFALYIQYLFDDTSCMNAEEIEQIVRQQMSDLQIKNPFTDDYYYCSVTNKKTIEQKRINVNFANWLVEALNIYKSERELENIREKEREELAQLPRVFGRIPSQNVRAPRNIFDFDLETRQNMAQISASLSINKDKHARMCIMIENGINILMQIQEHSLCQKQQQSNYDVEKYDKTFDHLCHSVWSSMVDQDGSLLINILSSHKGIKYVTKALKHLPEKYTNSILSLVMVRFYEVFEQSASKYEPQLKTALIEACCDAIKSHSTIDALCQILFTNARHVEHFNDKNQLVKIDFRFLSSHEGARILSVWLERANDLKKKESCSDSNMYIKIFIHLFNICKNNFSNVVKAPFGWKLATAFMKQCDNEQKKSMLSELRPLLNKTGDEDVKEFVMNQ
ncbi:PAT1H [Acrasis kona]|uniref:PAT1H n=1 Tax=Acrasis kona TaxID=1008807 RepID=A0AAW2ZFB9_9EUKA